MESLSVICRQAKSKKQDRLGSRERKMNIKIGDKVKLIGRSYGPLDTGDIATLVDIQPGIFAGDRYFTVMTANNKRISGYDWRFAPLEEEET